MATGGKRYSQDKRSSKQEKKDRRNKRQRENRQRKDHGGRHKGHYFPVHLFDERITYCSNYLQNAPKFWGSRHLKPSSVHLDGATKRRVMTGRNFTPLSWLQFLYRRRPDIINSLLSNEQDVSRIEGKFVKHQGLRLTFLSNYDGRYRGLVVYRLQLKSGHYFTSTSNMCVFGINGLFARFIAFCVNEPKFAAECFGRCSQKGHGLGWFSEAKVDFWSSETIWNDDTVLQSTSSSTAIRCNCNCLVSCKKLTNSQVQDNVESQCGSQKVESPRNLGNNQLAVLNDCLQKTSTNTCCLPVSLDKVEVTESDHRHSSDVGKNATSSTVEFTENEQTVTIVRVSKTIKRGPDNSQVESLRRKSRFSDFAEVNNSEVDDQSTSAKNLSAFDLESHKESSVATEQAGFVSCEEVSDGSVLNVKPSDRSLVTTKKTKKSLLGILTSTSGRVDFKEKLQEERCIKIQKWRAILVEQIGLVELRNQYSAKKMYSLQILNKFDFVENVNYDVIYEDQIGTQEIQGNLVWLVQIKINEGMLKFYGQSKGKWSKALNNALIVALNFCTIKIVHEKVVPRHLKSETQFLTSCLLHDDMEKEINGSEKLPKVELKRKKNPLHEQVVKKRRRAKSVCDEIEESRDYYSGTRDDSYVFEVNLETENMHFCFERAAHDRKEALDSSLLHILRSSLHYSVV